MNELRFFNPYGDIRHTENRLPHWQQAGAVYFITFRVADAVPSHLLTRWESERDAWLHVHPRPWSNDIEREYHQRFSGAIERWLDAGHGACLLRRRECAEVVRHALSHFEGERVAMISSVIMPNHVHALFVQNPEWAVEKLIQSWKRLTRVRSTNSSPDLGAYGSATTSIVSCATKSISGPACATFGAIRRRRDWAKANWFSTRAELLGAFSEQGAAVCNRRT